MAKKHHSDSNNAIVSINLSRFHDLSHVIAQDMPIYPGNPSPEFQSFFNVEKDGVNVSKIVLGSHTGSHVDAPRHFISNAEAIDQVTLQKFIGEAIIIDVSKKETGHGITYVDLEPYSGDVIEGDILLLFTGTSEHWYNGNNNMQTQLFSYLDPSGADWIIEHAIKCIGIDSLSIEKYGSKAGHSHRKLLSNGVGIIEGLSNRLKDLSGKRGFLVCLPLPLKGLDGSPVRPILFDIPDGS
jgi:kynurenine formamidase